jgi:LacI family transcriptional regulator
MSTPRRRVALMLDLEWLYGRHSAVFAGTQRYAQECGRWDCVVDEFVDHSLGVRGERRSAYDGIIARATRSAAEQSRRRRIPLVNVWLNSPTRRLPGVFPDFAAHGRLAAEHLLGRGFRHFGCLSSRGSRSHRRLIEAFHTTLAEHGYECDCMTVSTQPVRSRENWGRFQNVLDRWCRRRTAPVGVLSAFNDLAGRFFCNACHRNGLRVPQDVAMVNGSNEPELCLQPPPSLTALNLDYERVGYEAARMLDEMMAGRTPAETVLLIPPAGLVARQSTDFFAVTNETVVAAMRFIERRHAEAIDVNDVAAAVHASRRTLERRFHAEVGHGVAAEIRRLRMEHARRLLVDTGLSMKEVAAAAGFRGAVQLNHAFQRSFGQSPRAVRHASPRTNRPG